MMVVVLTASVSADLVGYWSLDGNADADAGGWGVSSTQAGSNGENDISFPNDVPAAISLRVNQSIAFDANNDDRVITGFNAGMAGLSGTPTSTISFWVKRTLETVGNGGMVYLGGLNAGAGQVISFERNSANLAAYYFNGNRLSSGGFVSDQWIHVTHTYQTNHGGSEIYFDGVNVSGSNGNPANTLNLLADASFSLGDRIGGVDPTTGFQVSELAVWNEVLSPAQITALANGTSPLLIPEPSSGALLLVGVALLHGYFRRCENIQS